MKKFLLSLVSLLMLTLFAQAGAPYKLLTFPATGGATINNYTTEWTATVDGDAWILNGFNSNQNKWDHVRCGRKNVEQIATLTSPAVDKAITHVLYSVLAVSNVNSVTLTVLNGEEVVGEPKDITESFITGEVVTEVAGAAGYSYRLTVNSKSASGNGSVQIGKVALYEEGQYVDEATHIANTAETAYTVAEAIALIEAGESLSETVYVKGIVSQVDKFNESYKSIQYWISDDGTTTNQFECYSGKGIGGADFASIDDVKVGASVIVKGTMKKYAPAEGDPIYEFNQNNELVSYEAPAAPAVATPVITPNGGYFLNTQQVTFSCETEGADIYYTIDGSDPANGNEPSSSAKRFARTLLVTQNTTVRAVAFKDGAKSAEATATFTQIQSYDSFASMSGLESGAAFAYTGKALIMAKPTAKYVYVYDGNNFSLIYDAGGTMTAAAEVGKYITPGWTGKVSIYKELFELVPDNAIVVSDEPAQPINYPAIALGTAKMNQVFTLKGVTSYSANGKNISIYVNGEDKDISEAQGVYGYNQFAIEIPAFEEGKTYEIVGAIGKFNDKVQFWPILIQEETEPTPEPELSFYVTGTMTNWGIDANYKMTLNEELLEKGIKELSLTMNLKAGDEIKVASSNDGVEVKSLFPTGEGNAYVVPSDGEYTVYCRPNFDGDDETWIAKCLKVVRKAAPVATQNAGFEESEESNAIGIRTYQKDVKGEEVAQMQEVTGWTIVENGDARAAGVFAYGSESFLGGEGYVAPAAQYAFEEGATKALGMVAVWTADLQYTQVVNLAPGNYMLQVPVYNAGGADAVSANKFGADDTFASATQFTVDQWTVLNVEFTVEATKDVTISLGYVAANAGSGAMPHLFIESAKLYSGDENISTAKAEADLRCKTLNATIALDKAKNELRAAIAAAEVVLADYDPETEAYTAIATAITTAQKFLRAMTEETTVEQVEAAATALNDAVATAVKKAEADAYDGEYAAYVALYPQDCSNLIPDVSTWEGGLVSNKGQHWDGTGSSIYYEQTGDQWGQSSWRNSKSTTVTLPAGKYLVMAAGRSSSGTAVEAYMQLGETKVVFPSKGDVGFGVDIKGLGTMSENAIYANNNLGRGWEYRYIAFESDGETPITLTIGGSATANYQWMSITQPVLRTEATLYTVTISDEIVNGTVEATPTEAKAGETVSLRATPVEGYELKNITVTCKTTDEVVMVAEDGTFIMPADDVTVSATFRDLASIVYIETDLTSQFSALTNVSNWISGTSSNCGVVAAQFGPKVTVNGQKVQLIENYVEGQAKKQATGDVMYQTVTGLAAGTYSIELYGAANLTAGRSDMTTDFAEGDEASQKAVYLYAMTADGSTVKKYIPCLIEDNFNNRGGEEAVPTAKLEGIVVGEDGKVKIGIYKEVGLTNWHFVQLKSVIATVDADYALAPHVAAVRAIEESTVPPALYTQIEEALINYDNRFDTAQDYLDAIEALDAIAAKAKAYAPIAELLAKGEEYKAHVAEGNEAIATYEAAVADVKAAFTDVAIPDFAAAQEIISAALPALGKAQTKAGADMTLFAENLAWTCPQGNGPGNYQGCTETYTEGSYTTGKVMYQKVEGLPAGFYKVEFIAVANHARGASAYGENIAQIYANDATEDITVENQAACTPADYVRTLTTFVKDGVLEYGLQNIADGGNWYVAKLNAITLVEPTNPAPTNLDFADTEAIDKGVCTYAKDMATNSTTYFGAQAVDGWTALNPSDNVAPETEGGSRGELDQRAGAVVAYGSTAWLGGSANVAPASGPEGSNGKGLGMVAVWTSTVQYTQPVTLDAGTYTLEIPVYNSVGGTTVPAKSLIGFIASDGTEYLAPAKAYTVNTWITETVTFTLDAPTNGVFSLGYTMTDTGNGNAPHLFFDCVNIITDPRAAVRSELKGALSVAQATINAMENVGDQLFQKPTAAFRSFADVVEAQDAVANNEEATLDQLQAAIDALADASATYDAAINVPEAEKLYTFELSLGGEEPLYMNLAEGGITIAAEATPLKFIATENAGQYNLANEDETLFVGLAGGNAWTMSTAADKKAAWTFTVLGDGAYRINNLVTVGRFVGTNSSDKSAGNPCYADKQTSNGNVDWLIAEYVVPAVVLNAPTWSVEEGTQAEPTMLAADETLKITYTADNLEENGYKAEDLKVKVSVMVSGDLPENVMNMQSETKHSVMGESFYIDLGEVDFPVELKAGYVYQNIVVMTAQLVVPAAAGGEEKLVATYAGAPAQLHWIAKEAAPAQTYAINITPAENGTVKVDKETAAEGETVTVTVTPAEGYMVDEAYWTFVDGAGTPQKNEFREPEAGNSASFTMPAADVTITITFKEIPAPGKEYQGLIEQTLTTPDGAVMGSDTGNQTVTITAAGEGKVNITFSGFKFPIMPTTLPEFTIEGVKTEETNGIISYAINDYTLVVEGSGNGQMGGATAMYTVNLLGTQEGAEATPVMMMTLETRVLNTVYFGADQDAIDAYKKTTGINDVKGVKNVGAIYDLSGRKVEKMVKGGVYIVNGKKVSFK